MQRMLAFAALLGAAAAAPFELISKRPLADHEWTRRDDGCPAYLQDGQYEFPHYITYISSASPDTSYGQQYDGKTTPGDISSVFNFDIPADRADANCTLEFIFPQTDQLQTSWFNYYGPGTFLFKPYNPGSCPGQDTTYNNQPASGEFPDFPPIHMEPGNVYTIDVGPCSVGAGGCVSGAIGSPDTSFEYFQDIGSSGCPIGLYNSYSYGLPPAAPSS